MKASVQQLKSHLYHYLHLSNEGETVVVTSHDKLMAIIESFYKETSAMPDIPLVK